MTSGINAENVVNQAGDFSPKLKLSHLPQDIVTLTARKLAPYELNAFQLVNKQANTCVSYIKISYAQEFGYDKVDILGSRKFLHEIYREVEKQASVIGRTSYCYDPLDRYSLSIGPNRPPLAINTMKIDPEATLRRLQNLFFPGCFEILKKDGFYKPEFRKTRNYIIKIADRVFSLNDVGTEAEREKNKGRMKFLMRCAIQESEVGTITLLLNHGADIESVEVPPDSKCSALLHACKYSRSLDVFELLLSRGASIHAQYNSQHGVFFFLEMNKENGAKSKEFSLSVAKLLLDRGANPNVGDWQGFTPLHNAVERGDYAYANLLLKHGANIRQPNNAGQTPLSIALKRWDFRMVNMLLLGFDPYSED